MARCRALFATPLSIYASPSPLRTPADLLSYVAGDSFLLGHLGAACARLRIIQGAAFPRSHLAFIAFEPLPHDPHR
jgi:hypothetical protein